MNNLKFEYRLTKEIRKRISILKYELEFKNMNDLLCYLYMFYMANKNKPNVKREFIAIHKPKEIK